MYKRPVIRPRFPPSHNEKYCVEPGTFLHGIVHPPPTKHHVHVVQPIYRKNDYIRLYTKHVTELGLKAKELRIPEWNQPVTEERVPECHIDVVNPIHLQLRILKNGIVRVKLNTIMGDLHDAYYSKQKSAPLKAIIQAYKSIGYSNTFLEKIIKSHDKKIKITESFNIDTTFGKEPVKKKKKKEEPDPQPALEEEDEEEEEEDDPGEDGEMDVERDDDDEVVDQNAEEFIDDDE